MALLPALAVVQSTPLGRTMKQSEPVARITRVEDAQEGPVTGGGTPPIKVLPQPSAVRVIRAPCPM